MKIKHYCLVGSNGWGNALYFIKPMYLHQMANMAELLPQGFFSLLKITKK